MRSLLCKMGRGSVFSVAAECERFEELGPRGSVDQSESQNPSENEKILGVVDTAGPLIGVDCHPSATPDSELAISVAAWTKLPDAIRAGIAAMVRVILEN